MIRTSPEEARLFGQSEVNPVLYIYLPAGLYDGPSEVLIDGCHGESKFFFLSCKSAGGNPCSGVIL